MCIQMPDLTRFGIQYIMEWSITAKEHRDKLATKQENNNKPCLADLKLTINHRICLITSRQEKCCTYPYHFTGTPDLWARVVQKWLHQLFFRTTSSTSNDDISIPRLKVVI